MTNRVHAQIAEMERQAGRADGEDWLEWHHRMHDAMEAHHASKGEWVDPVSKRKFPPGQQMKRDPNHDERRNLMRWRRTGKAPKRR